MGSRFVAKAGLKLENVNFLSLYPPECWNYSCATAYSCEMQIYLVKE